MPLDLKDSPHALLTIAKDCKVYRFGSPELEDLHRQARLYGGGRYTRTFWYVVFHPSLCAGQSFYTLNNVQAGQVVPVMYDLPTDFRPHPNAVLL